MSHYKIVLLYLFSCCLVTSYGQSSCIGEQGKIYWKHYHTAGSDIGYLTHLHNYPNTPDIRLEMDRFTTDTRGFTDQYRSIIQGFLTVPENGNYTFNLTADDDTHFFLSTNDQAANKTEIATVPEWTGVQEFDKYPEQTSMPISLVAGNYYYFEVNHREGGGGDHINVQWKTPTVQDTFLIIPGEQLYDYTCSPSCPKAGTACEDGDSQTIADQEDGFCNCFGTPTNSSSCIGERNTVTAFYYKGIPNNRISDLEALASFPLMPDTLESLSSLNGPILFDDDNYGTRISGFLRVPVTGSYEFNISNDDRGQLKLSTDENPDNASIIASSNYTPRFDHTDEVSQSSGPISLVAGNFYFFEYLHVQGGGGDRYAAFWKTPFQQDTLWRYIDQTYLYAYNCELACMPVGTPCDDGSDLTVDDQFDDNCNCAGTPCGLPDCREFKNYTPTDNCGVTDQHSTNPIDAWLSCQTSNNPNPARGNSHWIQYDFGQTYLLHETHIWNYNVASETTKGFKNVSIDYSTDGTNWTTLGNYSWEQATGTKTYTGFEGPNFNGIQARYILLTATDNWGDATCSGFSKITFGASDCLTFNQPCNDNNDATFDDRYDLTCTCIGQPTPLNNCGPEMLVQSNIFIETGNYDARMEVRSQAIIETAKEVNLVAGQSVTLGTGFHAKAGSSLLVAIIDGCNNSPQSKTQSVPTNNPTIPKESILPQTASNVPSTTSISLRMVNILPNPTTSWTTIDFDLTQDTKVSLVLFSTDGRKIFTLLQNQYLTTGTYRKSFPAQRLPQGVYYAQLRTEQGIVTKAFVVQKVL